MSTTANVIQPELTPQEARALMGTARLIAQVLPASGVTPPLRLLLTGARKLEQALVDAGERL